jgi:hypothetical protein
MILRFHIRKIILLMLFILIPTNSFTDDEMYWTFYDHVWQQKCVTIYDDWVKNDPKICLFYYDDIVKINRESCKGSKTFREHNEDCYKLFKRNVPGFDYHPNLVHRNLTYKTVDLSLN